MCVVVRHTTLLQLSAWLVWADCWQVWSNIGQIVDLLLLTYNVTHIDIRVFHIPERFIPHAVKSSWKWIELLRFFSTRRALIQTCDMQLRRALSRYYVHMLGWIWSLLSTESSCLGARVFAVKCRLLQFYSGSHGDWVPQPRQIKDGLFIRSRKLIAFSKYNKELRCNGMTTNTVQVGEEAIIDTCHIITRFN